MQIKPFKQTAVLLMVVVFSLFLQLPGNCRNSKISLAENDFPSDIELKNPSQTFTHKYYFLLKDGRIWSKSRIKADEPTDWQLLNGTGLPAPGAEKAPYPEVTSIKSISADGDNLIAVSQQDIVYYTKTFNWKWKDHFSAIPLTRKLVLPADNRTFGISHRGNFMKYYNDIDGNPHKVGAGVTTLYLLAGNGHMIYFADPWLPPQFTHIVDTPQKGTFIARTMSVSGSTIFLMNAAGEMYTRLYDYDTSGQNPVLPYSYKRENRKNTKRNNTRSLPAEPWRKQPSIVGKTTDLITILQTGEGNSSFELRVEGIDDKGNTGYYTKRIYAKEWTFNKTGNMLQGTILKPENNKSALYTDKKIRSFTGKLKRGNSCISAELVDFWEFSPPATIKFHAAKQSFSAKLHMRKYHHRKNKQIACAATIELPDDFLQSENPECKALAKDLFAGQALIDMVLVVDKSKVNGAEDLHQIGISEFADTIVSLINKNGLKGEIKARFEKKLRLEFYLSDN